MSKRISAGLLLVIGASWPLSTACGAPPSRAEAAAALRRAVEFFRTQVAVEGGYVWRYSADLRGREGERPTGPTTAWVQPPGTPTVGEALLTAYELTGERTFLDAARETALALVRGQLQSGGWDYNIEFAPEDRRKYAYRVDAGTSVGQPSVRSQPGDQAAPARRNSTTLDDDTTQSAVRFLMRIDRALEFKDRSIHDTALFALESLLKAQYPNGAWPQRYFEFPDPARFPVKRASYPPAWLREFPGVNYSAFYTLNDDTLADTIGVMFDAADIYGDARYKAAAARGGDFLLLAQMPEPQPAWAQQYNADMHPAWARKFEPPAITGGESRGAIQTLLQVYRRTGDRKYLQPIPRALEYLKKSRLPDGRLARFYELQTNRPLYFTKDYKLVYTADDLPTHYGFIVNWDIDALAAEYDRVQKADLQELNRPESPRSAARMSSKLAAQAQAAVSGLDSRGAWVEAGRLRSADGSDANSRIIQTETFVANVTALARFIAASAAQK